MQRILVVKVADVGDVLTATPALRTLRRTFPSAEITALVAPHCRPVLEGNPNVDGILTLNKRGGGAPLGALRAAGTGWDLRRRRFDAVLLMHHLTTAAGALRFRALMLATGAAVRAGLDNGRGGFLTHRAEDLGFGVRHEVEYCNAVAGLLGAPADLGPLDVPLGEPERRYAATVLAGLPRPVVAVHPGAGAYSLARRWPADRFATLVAAITGSLAASVVVVGGPEERGLAAAVAGAGPTGRVRDMAGRTTLPQAAALLEGCDLFVGNDSGLMHLAAAAGTKVVALFGPSNHRAWGPWTEPGRSVVIRSDLPCSPCFYRGRSLGTPEGCPARPCLHDITPDQAVATIERFLTGNPAPLSAGSADR